MGFEVIGHSVLGDHEELLSSAFAKAWREADLVIASGGLGPTNDDVTKQALCTALGNKLVLREGEAERLRRHFEKRKRTMTDNNLRQALFPEEAELLANHFGTASGMYVAKANKMAVLLPGPPKEMGPMFKNELVPIIKEYFQADAIDTARKTIKVFGPGESMVETLLAPVIRKAENYQVAFRAVEGEVHIKIAAEGKSWASSQAILDEAVIAVENELGSNIFAYDDDTMAQTVANLLCKQHLHIALAESCTGGMIAKLITDVPGSSDVFWGAVTVYSNEAKMKLLGVPDSLLQEFGAVSSEVAQEMARQLLRLSGVDIAMSVTGIAGPEGGTPKKPVGLVYIGWAYKDSCYAKEMHFAGDRDSNRLMAAKTVLDIIRREAAKI